jgi:hypothetical protein
VAQPSETERGTVQFLANDMRQQTHWRFRASKPNKTPAAAAISCDGGRAVSDDRFGFPDLL